MNACSLQTLYGVKDGIDAIGFSSHVFRDRET